MPAIESSHRYISSSETAQQITDEDARALYTLLGEALLAAPSPYSAQQRVATTTALSVGDFKAALDFLGVRPDAEPESVLAWWDAAFSLACDLEDRALVSRLPASSSATMPG